ncbi:MAG: phosphate ABC transporter substrate-binding protein [Candidatus Omnitrophica bacterium]|nr:phosphate ABC transporter substrate-binding protein [Candidatus Omnitrophota bacterium]
MGLARADEFQGSIQIKGSDTMVNLCQAWAEAWMVQHPKVNVAVTGGGSGAGLAALISGTCDLAASSRTMSQKEIALARAHGQEPQEWKVALDGIAVVVHPSNSVRQLTIEQLAHLFSGKIRNWKELGGEHAQVVLLSREVNSGTHVYFKEHVLSAIKDNGPAEFAPEALLLPSSQAIADEAASNSAAVGYYGMGYLNPKNAAVAIAKTPADPYISPTEETVRSGAYPISRPLLFYSRSAPHGAIKAFLDFVMSPEGQEIIRTVDFVPVR